MLCYIIKLHDRAFMGVHRLGGVYEFYWELEADSAIRFISKNDADLSMMAIRVLRPEMFPTCLPEPPIVVELDRELQMRNLKLAG